MFKFKNKSPKAFRLMDMSLSSGKLLIALPSSRLDAKPFVGCTPFLCQQSKQQKSNLLSLDIMMKMQNSHVLKD
jgi:hypothetical protein